MLRVRTFTGRNQDTLEQAALLAQGKLDQYLNANPAIKLVPPISTVAIQWQPLDIEYASFNQYLDYEYTIAVTVDIPGGYKEVTP
jgi:hypothetical protein